MTQLQISGCLRLSLALGLGALAGATDAAANCVTTVNTTNCTTAAPNPYTSTVGTGNRADADNQTVVVDTGAVISSGNASAISLRDNANITVNGTVQNYATNSAGGYNTGGNTIEFRNNGTLTINAGAQVLSNGTQRSAEAINVQGAGNTIVNDGLVNAVSGAAIWSQNAGLLTVINNGTISTGALNNPSRTAAVIGGNTNAGIDFTNRGTVYGSLNLGSGADQLRLFTGSTITGNFSGGGGIDSIYLNGAGTDSLAGQMTGFEYLYKQDAGTWSLTGSIVGLTAANVQAGTLILTGNNTGFTGQTTVSSGATLQGSSQSLPGSILNDGLVRFDQAVDGSYGGLISGSGGLEKTGAAVLTLTTALAYGGDTTVTAGTLVLTGDNSAYAGAATVSSGATLQGNALSLPGPITNNGLVRFDQGTDGNYAGTISGTGGVEKTGAGQLEISSAQTYTGETALKQGSLLLTGSLQSPTSVAADTTLLGTGSITGTVTNAGTIAPGTPGNVGTLTIAGDYVGQDGRLAIRVDGQPSAPQADVLRISGQGSTASGSTAVMVTDMGGLGAPTTGNGILVIDAANGAKTDDGSFVLGERVAAGAYEYNLIRGETSRTTQSWYLATHEEPAPRPGPDPGPDPQPQPTAEPPVTYRVETSNYTALPALQRLYTYALVDTLVQRRGDIAPGGAAAAEDGHVVWGRAAGNFGETSGSGSDAIDLSYDFGFLQAGLDAVVASDGRGGRIYSGAFLALGQSYTDTSTDAEGNTGDAAFNAYSGGVYGTWFGASGAYGDAIFQVTRFAEADAHSSGDQSISTDGWSQSFSFEAGYRVALSERVSLTPQGQIIGENFTLDGASDSYGDVHFDNGITARGRLGLELGSSLAGIGAKTDVMLRANVWHVFADSPQTTFTTFEGSYPVSFDADIGSSWLAIDAGFTMAFNDNVSMFGNAGYEYGFGDSRQAGTGRLGLAVNW